MNKLMIDIETMSVRDDAAVMSVGLVVFNNEFIIETAYFALSPTHGHIDVNTVKWWLTQNENARYSIAGADTIDDADGMHEVRSLQYKYRFDEVWANSPNFDLIILRNWWTRVTSDIYAWPFDFRTYRDMRTLRKLASALGIDVQRDEPKVAHSALADAVAQAQYVIAQLNEFVNHYPKVGSQP